MTIKDLTVVIADDLTGASDTALQYFKKGSRAKVLIESDFDISDTQDTDVLAISTETRNAPKEVAVEKVIAIAQKLKTLSSEDFYKKIDSTLRGNIGLEVLALLEILDKDLAFIVPAYIEQSRTTIGGYQIINGIPIERSQCALDPKTPIFESYIPDILKKNINEKLHNLIGIIDFKTISKGAGPITLKINELYKNGKRIIVMDAMSIVDLEQIALAVNKTSYNVLPCGSAGLAEAINKLHDNDHEFKKINSVPNLPRLIVMGSATNTTYCQIEKLKSEKKNIYSVDLTTQNIVEGINEDMILKISQNLKNGKDVLVHSSYINKEIEKDEIGADKLIDAGIPKDELPSKITDFMAKSIQELSQEKFILIVGGGETAFKCAQKLNSKYLQILDAILPAIPLTMDYHGRIIVTKSGNFGNNNTLIDIINYLDRLKEN